MSQKRHILVIHTGAMELGGVERSLLGLLQSFDFKQYDVDLFLYAHHGPLMPYIPSEVNLLPEVKELAYIRESFITKLKNRCFYSCYLRIIDLFKSFFTKVNPDISWKKIMHKYVTGINSEYDMALSFFLPFDFLIEKVHAKIKVGWVHTDYGTQKFIFDHLYNQYAQVDKIAVVSSECKKQFLRIFPSFEAKTLVVENIFSQSFIREQADMFAVNNEMPDEDTYKLVSVGRFVSAKNFDQVPRLCKLIINQGVPIKWYLIGYGGDESLIRQEIINNGMQNHVHILGKKINPYPYMKACDLYVQPSRYEGKAVTVIEAQILARPVAIARFPTSASQLQDGVDGVIFSQNIEEAAIEIANLLKNESRRKALSQECENSNYSNDKEINKLLNLIGM